MCVSVPSSRISLRLPCLMWPVILPNRFLFASRLSVLLHQTHKRSSSSREFCLPMSTNGSSQSLTHAITLPCQPDQPVHIVAAPGISDSVFRKAHECSLFKQWLSNLQSENGILATGSFLLKQVLIQGVDMFGLRIGFLKFKADIYDSKTGKMVPGLVFARGPAAAVLLLLDSEDETYAVLTEQARVPTGRVLLELPAGMPDGDQGGLVGTAIREVKEETGIDLNLDDMIDLTAFLDPNTGRKVFPSPGGCDEEISLFLYRTPFNKEGITQLQGKETGLREGGELIKVHVVPYRKLWQVTADAKVLTAIAIYEMAKKEGLLQKPHPA